MARGFTLFELVVSLAILLALSSLVFPAVSRRIAGETGEAVSREIRAGVADVRSRAIGESMALRVEFELGPGGGEWRLVSRALAERSSPSSRPFVGPLFDDADLAPVAAEEESTLVFDLPRGATVSRTEPAPVVEGDFEGADVEGWLESDGSNQEANMPLCLGVLLPTGGAVAGAAVYVELPGSWTLVVTLDPWTGTAVVSRRVEPTLEGLWPADEGAGLPDDGATGRDEGARR